VAERWRNWAGQQRCAPEAIERPRAEEEVAEAVRDAAARGLRVRAVGAGHSFTDVACTDGVMVDLSSMDQVLDHDPRTGLVRVQAGMVMSELARALDGRGLALENQGDIDVQAIAGAVSTATHGTGVGYGNLSSRVEAMRLVTATGEVVDLNTESDPEGLRAARVGVGALGVITELTLRCVPAFTIRRVADRAPLAETLALLDEHVERNDHFEVFVFPYSDLALTLESRRTDEQPEPGNPRELWVREVLLENVALGAAMRLGRAAPRLIRQIGRQVPKLATRTVKVDRSWRVYASQRKVRFTEMEYALPRQHGREAVERVLELVERRGLPVCWPLEVRWAAADDAFLSTAYGRETCYVAVHQYVGMEYETYFRAVERIMDDYDGRPHWGKRHYQTAPTLAPRYPDWDRFQGVRSRLDPSGVFANDYTDRVLGQVPSAVAA
jgi:FAD-linked oxidoreductase